MVKYILYVYEKKSGWKSKYLSADGVCFKSIEGDIMTVECCLEPWSEDWFDAKISSLDGSIIYTPIEFHE